MKTSAWHRIILLIVLGYESAGCLLGGAMLMAQPDGHLMKMPVDMMHGAFVDFLVPGIILFGLGILNTIAFLSVLRRSGFDWFLAGLALGGLFIWFWVEIAIIRELVWLHAMWGIPVLLGWVVLIPLIALRHDPEMMRKILLTCGVLSSLWYVVINIFVPMQYEGYSMVSQAPSELSAFDAPTRILWFLLVAIYPLLFTAFGWGVWQVSGGNRKLRIVGGLIIAYCVMNFYWPPMHTREVIAASGGTLSDTLHLVWATMTVLFMMLMMGFGAAALGKNFRLYTIANFIIFMIFGALTFMQSGNLEANLPTPFMGLWERINIAAFMIWVIVFATVLMRGSLTEKFQSKPNIGILFNN
jgi:hypothetical protein